MPLWWGLAGLTSAVVFLIPARLDALLAAALVTAAATTAVLAVRAWTAPRGGEAS